MIYTIETASNGYIVTVDPQEDGSPLRKLVFSNEPEAHSFRNVMATRDLLRFLIEEECPFNKREDENLSVEVIRGYKAPLEEAAQAKEESPSMDTDGLPF